tara:strand:+ start:135 stop:419 length:285 start_codon:yes stop_codon:yes gene_type:complete
MSKTRRNHQGKEEQRRGVEERLNQIEEGIALVRKMLDYLGPMMHYLDVSTTSITQLLLDKNVIKGTEMKATMEKIMEKGSEKQEEVLNDVGKAQ